MNILITGGAGYIGSVLVPLLLEKGHTVTVIDNFLYHQASLLDVCHDKKLTILRGDARDTRLLKECLKRADVVFPLAALTGAPVCDRFPQEAQSVIVDAVGELLKIRSKGQIIVYPTTNSGYGVGQKDVYCTEKTPLHPISRYGKLKAQAETMILGSGNAVTLRLATAFGVSPRMRIDLLVNDFVYHAVTDRFIVLFEAHFTRNFIHVRDVARAFLHTLTNFPHMKNQAYNVGLSDANLSKRELCEEIKKQVPDFYITEANIGKDPDQRNYIVSNEKIEKTGFKPTWSLHDGIAELIQGYRIVRRNQYGNV